MNPILRDILETRLTTTPAGDQVSVGAISIDRGEAEFLRQIVAELRPAVTLEIGLAFGVSALAICDALPKTPSTRHIIIDPYQTRRPIFAGIGLHNLCRAGFEQLIEFHEAFSYRVLPQLEATGQRVDFAFIDGWHTFDFVLVDFFYIDKILRQGGVGVLDDADWPSIRRVIRYAVTNLPYSVFRTLPSELVPRTAERRLWEASVNIAGPLLHSLGRIPGLGASIPRVFGAEFLGVDKKHGIRGSCVALRKDGKDGRHWTHHVEF